MYFKEDFIINDKIKVIQPTLNDIILFGEERYFNTVYSLCAIPSDCKYLLWKMGYDYTEISDFLLFTIMSGSLTTEDTYLLLGDEIDLSAMEICEDSINGEIVLCDFEKNIKIDNLLYHTIVDYIRTMHFIKPKVEKAANKITKQVLIEEDKMKYELAQRKKSKQTAPQSQMLPLISGLINNADFKYDIEGIRKIGIYAFYDSLHRIGTLSTSRAILNGMYSGMLDVSKNKSLIDKADIFRDLNLDKS